LDNGFGGEQDTRALLEVRPHDVPFLLEDGQVSFKLAFYASALDPESVSGVRPGVGQALRREAAAQ